jgi:hypothetical protein
MTVPVVTASVVGVSLRSPMGTANLPPEAGDQVLDLSGQCGGGCDERCCGETGQDGQVDRSSGWRRAGAGRRRGRRGTGVRNGLAAGDSTDRRIGGSTNWRNAHEDGCSDRPGASSPADRAPGPSSRSIRLTTSLDMTASVLDCVTGCLERRAAVSLLRCRRGPGSACTVHPMATTCARRTAARRYLAPAGYPDGSGGRYGNGSAAPVWIPHACGTGPAT